MGGNQFNASVLRLNGIVMHNFDVKNNHPYTASIDWALSEKHIGIVTLTKIIFFAPFFFLSGKIFITSLDVPVVLELSTEGGVGMHKI